MSRGVRFLLNALALIALLVGVLTIVRFLGAIVAPFAAHIPFADWWKAASTFLREDGALWLSAIATVMLFVATRALYRSTNIQLSVDGPVLTVSLSPYPPPPQVNLSPYYYGDADEQDVHLAPHIQSGDNYIYLSVGNVQDKKIAVAGDVAVTVALHYGSSTVPHRYFVRRQVRTELIWPDTFVMGPVLNVGNLDAYLAVVESVEYRDLTGRNRTAAWGANVILKARGEEPIIGNKIFEPRKGEFSDGHRG